MDITTEAVLTETVEALTAEAEAGAEFPVSGDDVARARYNGAAYGVDSRGVLWV